MAKTRAPKKKSKPVENKDPLMDPAGIHKLLGIYGPYDPPPPPIPTKGFITFWDAGSSVNTLAKKHPSLFYLPRLYEGERCCRDSDSWKWRCWKIEPLPPELPFEEQQKHLKTGEQPATVREIVMYLTLRFLLFGERLDLGRLRTRDLAASGQRMTVWLSPHGFDIASVSDRWRSPGIGCSVMMTPVMHRKK